MDWWVAELLRDDPARLLAWAVWVIVSIVLHELAHGWAALWEGDRTPVETGHMTWNPLVHMGGVSLLMFALIGIAWGAMPVNPRRFRHRNGDALVSMAGPALNIALAIACILASTLWGGYAQSVPNPIWSIVLDFFQTGAFLNVVLAVFNLLPVPPLDGSRILASFSPGYRELISHPQAALIGLLAFFLLMGRFGGLVVQPIVEATRNATEALQRILPGATPLYGRWKASEIGERFREETRLSLPTPSLDGADAPRLPGGEAPQ